MRAPRSKSVCAGTHYIKFLDWIIFKLPSPVDCRYYMMKYKTPVCSLRDQKDPKLPSSAFSSAIQAITYADVIARYRSCPAVSHIWAFIVFPSTWMLLVANSTPMVLLLSKLNSLRVNRDRRLLLPTPESPISTTTRQKWHENQIPDVDNTLTITCNKHSFSGTKHEGKARQTHHPCHGSAAQVLIFLEDQSCHIRQHFDQMLGSTFTCYVSVSFAQHGRTFLLQEEYTWLSLQKSGTVWISHPYKNARTEKTKQITHTMQMKSVWLKKCKTQGRQQTLPAFYTPYPFIYIYL